MNTIDKALNNPEAGVPPPSRRKSASFAAQVIDLDVGQSCSRVEQINPNLGLLVIQQNITTMRSQFRDRTDPGVAAAKKATGNAYVTEVTDFMTNSRSWFIVAVVTRVE